MTQSIFEMTKAEKKRLAVVANEQAVFDAARHFLALKRREFNPPGTFDNAGRFFLSSGCPHCKGIRKPSRAYPYSEMHHGRTALHTAHQYGVEDAEAEVKVYAKLMEKYPILAISRSFAKLVLTITTAKPNSSQLKQ